MAVILIELVKRTKIRNAAARERYCLLGTAVFPYSFAIVTKYGQKFKKGQAGLERP
jgi:hypothetical protein